MADIVELERRISAALDRIGRGVEALEDRTQVVPEPQIDPGEVEALKSALEEERLANAQLEERVRAISEKQDSQVVDLRAESDRQKAEIDRLTQEVQEASDKQSAAEDAARETGVKSDGLLAQIASQVDETAALIAQLETGRSDLEAARAETASLTEAASKFDASALDMDLQRLRNASDLLRANNDKLRTANSEGLANAGLINESLEAQLAALKAERAADRAETTALMAALGPLLSMGAAPVNSAGNGEVV